MISYFECDVTVRWVFTCVQTKRALDYTLNIR